MIKCDLTYAKLEVSVEDFQERVSFYHRALHDKTGKGNDFLGWVDWPLTYDKDEFGRVQDAAKRIRKDAEVFLVCGIGGSYLGARAAIEFVQGLFGKKDVEVLYVGNTFSSTAIVQLLEYIKGKNVYCNVISKSGTTTETALAFRMIRQYMESVYGIEEAAKRIFATTDKKRGTLKALADKAGFETFTIPDDIGGRYSVLTSVGLLPIAVAGVDIEAVMAGAKSAMITLDDESLKTNPAYQYAVARRILENQGKFAEMLVSYESHLTMLAEWWKQLFGESEGKEGKGLLPASVNFSTDLHSMGQFVQEGSNKLFETVLVVDQPLLDANVPGAEDDGDQLNYLAGKSLDWVNKMAFRGTLAAHVNEGNVSNILLHIEDTSAFTFGYLVYFFFKACGMSVYLLDVNPFDQPGVEVYKRNMFKLLGKK